MNIVSIPQAETVQEKICRRREKRALHEISEPNTPLPLHPYDVFTSAESDDGMI